MTLYLLIFNAFALDSETCKKLECSNGPTRRECVLDLGTSVKISPCVDGLICDNSILKFQTDSWDTVYCQSDVLEKDLCEDIHKELYTGQVCCVSSNCVSNQCTNDRCEGTDTGDKCKTDEQCLPDHYCDGKCKNYVKSGCDRDNMCRSGHGCLDGKCTQYHTLRVGESADRGIFCKTGFVYNNKCDAIVAYSLNQNLGDELVCDIGSKCIYYTHNDKVLYDEGSCLCAGDNASPTGYCGIYADKSSQISQYYEAIVFDSSKCTGNLSHTDDPDVLYSCGSISAKQRDFNKHMLNRFKYFNFYKSTVLDHCARPQGMFDPWYQTSEFFSFGSCLLISLVIAIIN